MAKKQTRIQKNSLDTQAPSVEESTSKTVTEETQVAPPEPEERKRMELTLKRKSTQKNGVSTYSIEGLHASAYFNKTFFTGGKAPDSITIVADNGVIAEPGSASTAKAVAAVTPERAAKAAEVAKKAEERLQKAQERLAKQKQLAERLQAALGTQASA